MFFTPLRCLRFTLVKAASSGAGSGTKRVLHALSNHNSDHYVLDTNAHLRRQKIFEEEYKGKILIGEKALPEDENNIIKFMAEHFGYNEPINATLGKCLYIYIFLHLDGNH